MNQGAVRPIEVQIPANSPLRPRLINAAVCAGNRRTWDGTSGVHANMTNTHITDPEFLECRYLGGDWIVRDIDFRLPIKLSILSERGAFRLYGLEGGGGGKRGR